MLGDTENFMALLQEAVVVPSALATGQLEEFHCAQHLWQLSSQKHYRVRDRSQDRQSGVWGAITGSAAEQWLCNRRQPSESLHASAPHDVNKEDVYRGHRLCTTQLTENAWTSFNPRHAKNQWKILWRAVSFYNFPAVPPALTLSLLLAKRLWIFLSER